MQLILFKDNANREKNFHACMKSFSEMQLILLKDRKKKIQGNPCLK